MSLGFAKTVITEDYRVARPFPSARIDGLLDEELVRRVANRAKHWSCGDGNCINYENPLEKKFVCESAVTEIGNPLAELSEYLSSSDWLDFLTEMTGIGQLKPDTEFYGSGLNIVPPGGYLALHRDLEIHPKTGLERRLNLTVFLNEIWNDEWGGHLEFWSERDGAPYRCARRIRPKFGRIVLFDPQGFHGFPDPISEAAPNRLSLQMFYYAPAREGATRKRAWFMPRPQDSCVKMLNEFRLVGRS